MMIVASSSSAWGCEFACRRTALGLLLASVVCASCGSLPRTSYYTLRIPAAPPVNDPKTNFVLGVERFRATEMLRDDRIVYYESPTELNLYQYQRWSAAPGTMVAQLVARWLDDMGVFADVRVFPYHETTDYVLQGRLFNFEEVDSEAGTQARVALELSLVRSRDHKVVWSASRRVERPVQERGVAGVVNALSASSEEILRDMLPGLAAQVERDSKEAQTQSK